jgi:hypothetical protein
MLAFGMGACRICYLLCPDRMRSRKTTKQRNITHKGWGTSKVSYKAQLGKWALPAKHHDPEEKHSTCQYNIFGQ